MEKQDEIKFSEINQLTYYKDNTFHWNLPKMKHLDYCIYPKQDEKNIIGKVTHVSSLDFNQIFGIYFSIILNSLKIVADSSFNLTNLKKHSKNLTLKFARLA
jgi:hypothetical protein